MDQNKIVNDCETEGYMLSLTFILKKYQKNGSKINKADTPLLWKTLFQKSWFLSTFSVERFKIFFLFYRRKVSSSHLQWRLNSKVLKNAE